MLKISLVLLFGAVIAGCGGAAGKPPDDQPRQQCGAPRPEICTREYAPVCAFVGKDRRRQYSNGCTACADPAVSGYIPGPCLE